MQKTIASMGANNLLILPGAATSGGVSFGAGSVQTLTPAGLRRNRPAVPGRQRRGPDRAGPRPGRLRQPQLDPQSRSTAPRRRFSPCATGRHGRGRRVHRSRRAQRQQGLPGRQTIKRELFQDESPVGKEIRIQNVAFRVIGVLSRKGANMMGMDQDDIVLAPWTTIKYRVSGRRPSTNANTHAAAAASSQQHVDRRQQPEQPLSRRDGALSGRLRRPRRPTRRSRSASSTSTRSSSRRPPPSRSRRPSTQITELLRERHHIRPGADDDFNIRDMTEITKTMSQTSELMEHSAAASWRPSRWSSAAWAS